MKKQPKSTPLRGKTKVIFDSKKDHINLSALKEEFEFKWRVQSYSKSAKKAICVAYCDSRQVQDVFDRVCSPENWQDKYESIGDVIYCHIGIFLNGQWVWKSDCGSESNIEAAKGASSDAFKRAAVKWGVGRFLYAMRTYSLKTNKIKENGDKPWHLYCVDDNGNKINDWDITKYINNKRGCSSAVPASDPTAKGDEASSELDSLETWLSTHQFTPERIVKAMEWVGVDKLNATVINYKKNGAVNVPRAKYGLFCHLVQLTGYPIDIIDMCLEGLGYKSVDEGGINQMITENCTQKIIIECKKVNAQCDS